MDKRTINYEALELLEKLSNNVSGLFDYFYEPSDIHGSIAMKNIEKQLKQLKLMLGESDTYVEIRDNETGEIERRYYDSGDYALCHYAAKFYAFDDLDNTFSIVKLVFKGKELEYAGWQPGMLFEFFEVESGKIVYSNEFPEWDH
jgi:hypothetical protein